VRTVLRLIYLFRILIHRSYYITASNHASFFYSQLIALKILVNDLDGARNAVRAYFQGAFQDQFAQSGEQVRMCTAL